MLVEYLEKDVMIFRVYGFADVKQKLNKLEKPKTKKPINPNTSAADYSTDVSNVSSGNV